MNKQTRKVANKLGRNNPCPCGCGKKRKHCLTNALGRQLEAVGTPRPMSIDECQAFREREAARESIAKAQRAINRKGDGALRRAFRIGRHEWALWLWGREAVVIGSEKSHSIANASAEDEEDIERLIWLIAQQSDASILPPESCAVVEVGGEELIVDIGASFKSGRYNLRWSMESADFCGLVPRGDIMEGLERELAELRKNIALGDEAWGRELDR